jgi:hypothetical protein
MGFDRFDSDAFLAELQKDEKLELHSAKAAKVAKAFEGREATLAGLAILAEEQPRKLKIRAREIRLPEAPSKSSKPVLPAALEAILARFPGTEIVSVRRYDLPEPSQLEPLAMADHPPDVCAQCRDPDGLALRWLDRRQNIVVWLHKECRRHYLDRRVI